MFGGLPKPMIWAFLPPLLTTVAALVANGNTAQLPSHLNLARANGLSETELAEVMTHLAFYAGWFEAAV